jgi:hypothetical protein
LLVGGVSDGLGGVALFGGGKPLTDVKEVDGVGPLTGVKPPALTGVNPPVVGGVG